MKYFFFVLAILLCERITLAGDSDQLNFLGFSKDEQYAAFETFGYHDGSGHPYSNLTIVNVPKNRLIQKVFKTEGETEDIEDKVALDQTRSKTKQRAETTLERLGIKAGENLGTPLNPMLPLSLKTTSAKNFKECKIFSLTIKNKQTSQEKTLQSDTHLPTSRGCPTDYQVEKASLQNKSLIVFLKVTKLGFEGTDAKYLPVSGSLP